MEKLEPVGWESTAGIIAARIRERIIDGTFEPGSPLGEAHLAARLGVSRGPVREAMQRLIQEGLLTNRRNRGVCVISLGEGDFADIYFARGVIEKEAARILMRSGEAAHLEELEDLTARMSEAAGTVEWSELTTLDLRFHETLVASSGSGRLVRMFGTLAAETRICLSQLEPAYPAHERLVEEHRSLLEAMRRGDEARTLDLIDKHLSDAVHDLRVNREPGGS
ncbi:MAG: GntR family transcriptional regulator [Rubrobacter sp.]|nr:GntR family transcriptional regulator [Rubrobacter sp.]